MTLSEKVSIRALTIAQRINVLTVGLNDRSEVVKQACGQLLKAWLRSYEYKTIKLLEALDTEGSPECTSLVLETLFKGNFNIIITAQQIDVCTYVRIILDEFLYIVKIYVHTLSTVYWFGDVLGHPTYVRYSSFLFSYVELTFYSSQLSKFKQLP